MIIIMGTKAFRMTKLSDFLALANQTENTPKFVDTENNLAFFYARKRIEYIYTDVKEADILVQAGFMEGREIDSIDSVF